MHEGVAQLENSIAKLEEVDFELPELSVIQERMHLTKTYEAVFDGALVMVSASYDYPSADEKFYEISITARKGIVGAKVFIELDITKSNRLEAITDVNNYDNSDSKNRLFRGIGRTLWEASTKVIKKCADQFAKPIRHLVSKNPDYGLSNEKWDELFLPLLEKHGYKQVDSYLWEKIYKPE